jgi:hypothetical protein
MSQDKNPLFHEIDHILAGLGEPLARKRNTVPLIGPGEVPDGPVRLVQVDTYASADGEVMIDQQEVQEADTQTEGDERRAASQDTARPDVAHHRRRLPRWLPPDYLKHWKPVYPRAHRSRPRLRPHHVILLALSGVCTGVLAYLFVTDILPLLLPSVTVTIIPISRQIVTSDTITISTTPNALAPHQLAGRILSSVTMSQAQTAETTGKGHQDARAGHGYVTFYNALPAVQVIPAGTLLTGTDGVEVVTDTDAAIPAGDYATNGRMTISAHALLTGPQGNIAAQDITGKCCRDNVFVVNSAFHGGQYARDYQAVSQHDIDSTATSLKGSLDQSVQAALQTQVRGDESLLPLPCQQTVTADHKAGEEATQVRVTASETCTGIAYNAATFHDLVMQQQNQQASTQLGQGYALTGSIQTSVQHVTTRNGTITLQVKSSGTWAYQFSQAQQEHLKALIVGQSKAQAISTLLHVAGVQTVSIDADTLPSSPKGINLEFLQTL